MIEDQKHSEQQKKFVTSFPNSKTSGRKYMLSAACISFMLIFGVMNFSLHKNVKTGYYGGLQQAGFIPGITIPAVYDGDTLHVHFISGSAEYQSEKSLMKLKQILEEDFKRIRVTASWGEDAGYHLPDIDHLADADLMLVFTRRMTLPEDQLAHILKHVENEKPVIGIRTASHAFQDFLELDSMIFGGDYDGHGDDEPVELTIAEGAEEHSILKDVQPWDRPGKIYHNPELGPNTEILLYGEGLESNFYEPVAWTNIYGESGRAFYTSMGLPTDFENENFLQLLINAIVWTTQQELHQAQDDELESPGMRDQKGSYKSMNYGPVITESIRKKWPEGSLVRKGLAIRLDHDAAMIFDTDLVRFAAGTADGWLDITDTDYMSYKGSDIASVEGRQVFSTSEIAGWAKEDSFYGPRDDGMGSLPHDWAHYKGYYRHGDQIILSYTVGETDVLELPETIQQDGTLAFIRNMRISKSDHQMKALIFEKHESWSVVQNTDREVIIDTGETTLAVLLTNASNGVRIAEGHDKRIELHLPPSDTPERIRVVIFEMESPNQNLVQEVQRKLLSTEVPDLEAMTLGGPARWNEKIEMSGTLSEDNSGYVIDHIPIPFDNPWGSWMRLSGLDFFDDGTRAAISTWNGDVWIVAGIDETLENVKWRRFASGLFYPMGIAIVNDEIFVTERSQLTRLHDLDGNGEADYYENFNNDGIVYPMAHTLGLEVDSEGYFYFFKNGNRVPGEVSQHGALIRVSPDGKSREVYARGYRGANTLGIGPDDMILAADQEGNWVPVDRIDVMKHGGFYGDRRHGGEDMQVGEFEVPIAWTPKHVNNSSGLITYAADGRWGPLAGQWILGSYGQRTLFGVLTEEIGDKLQGGIVKLPVESTSGLMRGRVNPADGQLYVVGLRGWQTLASEDASFERIRYAGGNVNLPKSLNITPTGVEIEFTDPLDTASAQDLGNYNVERWEYLYSSRYGSPEMSLENPGAEGRDAVTVSSARISDDGRKLFLEIPDIRSVMQMKIAYNLRFDDGHESANAIYHTVNWLSEDDVNEKPEWQQRIISGWLAPGDDADQDEELVFEEGSVPEWYQQGVISFQRNCSACHTSGGVAPMMGTSEWAAGSHEALVRIILHGKRGERGVMTPFSWMDDEEIASIVSYIRMQWHEREAISASDVERIRINTKDRTDLWTEEELRTYLK